jgi:DNA-binding CsgD family transcriptional regulator
LALPTARPGADLGLAFERSLHPMLIADAERRYVDANPAACLFMRMACEEVLERRVDDFVPPEVRLDFERSWADFVSRGSSPAESEWYFPADESRVPIVVGTTSIRAGLYLIVVMPWWSVEEAESATGENGHDANGAGDRSSPLSDREREVLTLLAYGHSGEQIARELFISPETVRTHVQHVRTKLGATTRGHAIAIAITKGEISLTA